MLTGAGLSGWFLSPVPFFFTNLKVLACSITLCWVQLSVSPWSGSSRVMNCSAQAMHHSLVKVQDGGEDEAGVLHLAFAAFAVIWKGMVTFLHQPWANVCASGPALLTSESPCDGSLHPHSSFHSPCHCPYHQSKPQLWLFDHSAISVLAARSILEQLCLSTWLKPSWQRTKSRHPFS